MLGEVELDDSPASLPPQARRLLAVLAATAVAGTREGASRSCLADDLGATESATVRMAISRLRKALGERVVTTSAGYRLELVAGDSLDCAEFEQLVTAAAVAESVGARAALLGDALALWRGEAFGAAGDLPIVELVRARLDALRRTAVEDLADAWLADGRAEAAILLLEEYRDELRYRERPVEVLIRAHATRGRVTEALRLYERFRIELRDDVGVVPSSNLRALETQLLDEDGPGNGRHDSAATSPAARGVRPPTPLTALIGRDDVAADVAHSLRSQRLVTLVGTGGCGKTRLAIEVARLFDAPFDQGRVDVPGRDRLERTLEGPWFVALADLADSTLVARTIAMAMGRFDPLAAADSPSRTLDELIRALQRTPTLLVVDNCEHLRDACATAVARLVAGCPELRILATSREPLHILGERVVEVGPLDTPAADTVDAVAASGAGALFVQRAGVTSSAFTLDNRTAAGIAVLCRRLDGLPLALELVATRMRGRSVRQVLDGVTATTDEIGCVGSPVAHHSSMRAALQWSTDLLSEQERRMFRRLAVFRGGFGLDAAEAVGGAANSDNSADVAALVDKSLLVHDATGDDPNRYRMLEVVRDHATTLLIEHGELDDAGRRHRDHFRDRCAVASDRGTEAFQALRAEIDNVRAAITWSQQHDEAVVALDLIARYPCWQDLGILGEHDLLMSATLASTPTEHVPMRLLAWTLRSISIARTYRGDVAGAAGSIAALDELAAQHSDSPIVDAHAAFSAATRHYFFGDGDLDHAHRLMSLAQTSFDHAGRPDAYPAVNQLYAAVLFGVPPPHGVDAAAEDALTRGRATRSLVLAPTVEAFATLWQMVWGSGGSIDRCDESVAALLALHSGWERNLLNVALAQALEHAGHADRAARPALNYLRFARTSGLRILVADTFRCAARLGHSRRPDDAIRLWAAADNLAATTRLRGLAINHQRDVAVRLSTTAALRQDDVRWLEREGQNWSIGDAADTATAILANA